MFIDLPEGALKREIIVDFQTMETKFVSNSLKTYSISRFPITNEQFFNFIRETSYSPGDTTSYSHRFFLSHWWKGNIPPPEKMGHPVTYVNHEDAVAYAKFIGGRLPTYEEWLYAAYGSTGFSYPWGNRFSEKKCNVRESKIGETTPVGLFSPDGDSPFGCADMIGNIWEWTSTSVSEDDFLAMGTGWDHHAMQLEIPLDRVYRNHSVGFRVVRTLS